MLVEKFLAQRHGALNVEFRIDRVEVAATKKMSQSLLPCKKVALHLRNWIMYGFLIALNSFAFGAAVNENWTWEAVNLGASHLIGTGLASDYYDKNHYHPIGS